MKTKLKGSALVRNIPSFNSSEKHFVLCFSITMKNSPWSSASSITAAVIYSHSLSGHVLLTLSLWLIVIQRINLRRRIKKNKLSRLKLYMRKYLWIKWAPQNHKKATKVRKATRVKVTKVHNLPSFHQQNPSKIVQSNPKNLAHQSHQAWAVLCSFWN